MVQTYPIPDYVKQASVDELTNTESIPQHLYADDKFKLYPCHTPAATVISAAAYMEDKDKYSKERQKYIEERLVKHAKEQDIEYDVREILDFTPQKKEAYAYTTPERRFFPIRNATEIKKLANYLVENYKDIPQQVREEAAKNALAEAWLNNYNIGKEENILRKFAGLGQVNKEKFVEILKQASLRTSPRQIQARPYEALIPELLDAVEKIPEDDNDTLLKCVKAASDIINHIINPKTPIELQVVITEDEVRKYMEQFIPVKTGSYYTKDQIRSIPENLLKQAFDIIGEDITINGYVSKQKAINTLKQLDESRARTIEDFLKNYGVEPAIQESRSITIPL